MDKIFVTQLLLPDLADVKKELAEIWDVTRVE